MRKAEEAGINNILLKRLVDDSLHLERRSRGKLSFFREPRRWIFQQTIYFGEWQKEVASGYVFMARSALPTQNKRDILTAEAFRRLMNWDCQSTTYQTAWRQDSE